MKKAFILCLFLCFFGCNSSNNKSEETSTESNTSTEVTASDPITLDSTGDSRMDSESETGTASHSSTDTIVGSDTIADTDTGEDSESNVHTDSETGTDTDSTTGSDSESGTGNSCLEMGWECGIGNNDLGAEINCNTNPGCSTHGEWCDTDHFCMICNNDEHCGDDCSACDTERPRCFDGDSCVECLEDADCPNERPVCDTASHSCHECLKNEHCRPQIVVARIDGDTDSNSDTNTDTESDSDTEPDFFDTDTVYAIDINKPWLSPIGVCTPDHTCTCWAPTPERGDTDEKEILAKNCEETGCPDGYKCLIDFENGARAHMACLRLCNLEFDDEMRNGLSCDQLGPYFAWKPVTTCFTYAKIGEDCLYEPWHTGLPDGCRISKEIDGDAFCDINSDGFFTCNYVCQNPTTFAADDNMCPDGFHCPSETLRCAAK
ncbi:MAG: hypothetical protein JXR76_12215 [Deltaproteobacteria bacterium]|nr:hypothetical protein [Deltaproteobacteria bacterium]